MRCSRVFAVVFLLLFIFLSLSSASAEIKITVVDPQDAAVQGVQVQLLQAEKLIAVQNTSGDGIVTLRQGASSAYRLQVLAPGFAVETVDLTSKSDNITVTLRLAPAAESVVVTATRSPVASDSAGADVSTLNNAQLEVMNPIAGK